MKYQKLAVLGVILFCLGLGAISTLAFMVSPVSFKVIARRGSQQNLTLTIRNNDSRSINCRVYATNFEVVKDGKQLFEKASGKFSALEMLEITDSKFSIPAGKVKKVEIKVSVSRRAETGEYFATIMSESEVPARVRTAKGITAQVAIRKRIGSIVRITVPGRTIRKEAEISEVSIEMPNKESKEQDIKVKATLKNECKIHLDAQGEAVIKNSENRIFDKFVLQGAKKNVRGEAFVFPQNSRDFWGTIERPLPPGKYLAEISFDYGYSFRKAKAETEFEITPETGQKQKEFLVMTVKPNLVKLKMKPGAFRSEHIEVSNLGVAPLEVKVSTQVFTRTNWLEVLPEQLIIRPGHSKSLRIKVLAPKQEPIEKVGKIFLKPERGKEICVDVVVSKESKRKEVKNEEKQ